MGREKSGSPSPSLIGSAGSEERERGRWGERRGGHLRRLSWDQLGQKREREEATRPPAHHLCRLPLDQLGQKREREIGRECGKEREIEKETGGLSNSFF